MDAKHPLQGLSCPIPGKCFGEVVVVPSECQGTPRRRECIQLSVRPEPPEQPLSREHPVSVLVYHQGVRDASLLDHSLWGIPKSGSFLLSPWTVLCI